MSVGGGDSESEILSLRRTAGRTGNKAQREMAIGAMREGFGFDGGGVRDMSVRELNYFMDYIDHLDLQLE